MRRWIGSFRSGRPPAAQGAQRPRSASLSRAGSVLRSGLPGAVLALALLLPGTTRADQRDPRLDGLFEELRTSRSPEQASRVAERIWAIWNRAGDEEIDDLMRVASRALDSGDLDRAVILFSRIIEQDPDFAEGWNKRATAYFQMGRYEASMRDVAAVLELEPRHFAAMSGMGLIYSELGAESPALRWFERALAVHPYLRGVPEQAQLLWLNLHRGDI